MPGLLEGKRIIVCEDEGVTVMQLHRALTRAGLIVSGAVSTGEEAVALALKERPDIVLMDVGLDGMDGLEATRQIIANRPTCVVLLTGQQENSTRTMAEEVGAASWMLKPVSADVLIPVLEQALQRFYDCSTNS